MQDIRPISIQIPYYTNLRNVCRYYMFYSINFAMYKVESIMLSSYVVRRKDLLIHTMLLDGFTFLDVFVTPTDNAIGIKLRAEFSHIVSS